jgi:metallo-beta-lactamase family protein
MDLTFLGAAGTVTGSKYLLQVGSRRILIDCGLFQGLKHLRLRNREPFPVDPREIDTVLLTHAHLDHSGYLPLLVRQGYAGPVYCTPATRDLCGILLPDSGHLQEEAAAFATKHGFSRHSPALPLYTEADARRALPRLLPVDFGTELSLGDGISARFSPAGHILGAAMIELRTPEGTIHFSGDLGRPGDPLLPAPTTIDRGDVLVVESTYGDRLHDPADPADELAQVIRRTAERGGAVLIPSFAVGRAQTLLYLLHRLRQEGRIPRIPIYLDSPMAAEATRIHQVHARALELSDDVIESLQTTAVIVASVQESKEVDRMHYPRVIISASGMVTGGRVLHHMRALAPDRKNTILLVGYQAMGTRGAQLLAGVSAVKIHGTYVPIHAEVASLSNLSAHADWAEIVAWARGFSAPPSRVFITHGEPVAADALRLRLEEALGWRCEVPMHGEHVVIDAAVQFDPAAAQATLAAAPAPGH